MEVLAVEDYHLYFRSMYTGNFIYFHFECSGNVNDRRMLLTRAI